MKSTTINQNSTKDHKINISREGQHYADKIAKTLQGESIGVNVLEIAWTAGPVTFIALETGHFLGFGNLAPVESLIYFVSYTLVAGIIGASIRLFYKPQAKRKANRYKQQYLSITDTIANAYLLSRDLQLKLTDESEKKYEAARILLNNLFITPSDLECIIDDVTDNTGLAKQTRKIIINRRAGMNHYANDLLQQLKIQYTTTLNELNKSAPQVLELTTQHLEGKLHTIKQGLKRPAGFIERIVSATRVNDPALIGIEDVQAILILALEFLYGRSFSYFAFRFRGDKALVEAFQKLEALRHELKVITSGFYSRLNALHDFLSDESDLTIHLQHDSSKDLIAKSHQYQVTQLNYLYDEINEYLKLKGFTYLQSFRLKRLTEEFSQAVSLYKKVYAQNLKLNRKLKQFEQANKRWQQLIRRTQTTNQPENILFKKGIDLVERNITLNEKQTMGLVNTLEECLNENKYFSQKTKHRSTEYKPEHAVNLAMNVTVALDELINISEPSIQNAIESSCMAALNGMEFGHSATYKLGLGVALVQEVKKDLSKTIEQMVKTMRTVYHTTIDEESLQFFHEKYGASLTVMQTYSEEQPATSAYGETLATRFSAISPPAKQWQNLLEKASHRLRKQGEF